MPLTYVPERRNDPVAAANIIMLEILFCSLSAFSQSYGAFPLADSDSYSDYCTDSDSMQKCSTGTDSYGDSYANHRHFASLFEKLIVVSIDPVLACLVIPTTGLYNNFHSFNN